VHPEQHPERTPHESARRPRVVAAIPARFGSTRLPAKALHPLAGRPMVEHVYGRARRAPGIDRVVVLTDHEAIGAAVDAFGGEWEMTPESCASGTDRIAWAAARWDAEVVLNVQGDEPLIDPAAVGELAQHLAHHPADPIATLAAPAEDGDFADPNAVKVVLDTRGYALYFSRAGIPFPRQAGGPPVLKHLGIYGYQREALLRFAALTPTPLERAESLEQLRALENGMPIRVLRARHGSPSVDTLADAERVERALAHLEANHGR
jgi:3-deoxy-manno-octulosonate cytidylyltransferase (CMP-KDO synthetase)